MVKPEGCGKPKIADVHPRQRRVNSLLTPKISRKHWSQQKTQMITVE
ncbi:hypothetical protein IKF81_01400 [Candidatus Saccharibacteria bacterium]|nr:hypothetical protein [Candidatus Saccharibacteria bacterium]